MTRHLIWANARPTLTLVFTAVGVSLIAAVLIWQAVAAGGNPDPNREGLTRGAMSLSSGVLVFREGLEAILVLAAITAGLARGTQREFARAVALGALAAFLASVATWFVVAAVIASINAPELHIQAATGLVAIVVLLVVMNWFFHKFYWTGWISSHSNRRRHLLQAAGTSASRTFVGLALLGFTAVYREGFEIVLFLQDLRLKAGNGVILHGVVMGLGLTAIVAALTFAGQKRLPYRKMLVATGVLLGVVLLVMVGESVQEMQLAGWLPTTPIILPLPKWLGLWFSVFPNIQSLAAQVFAACVVIGSYISVPYVRRSRPGPRHTESAVLSRGA
jgi:high-affinity iron transporter